MVNALITVDTLIIVDSIISVYMGHNQCVEVSHVEFVRELVRKNQKPR